MFTENKNAHKWGATVLTGIGGSNTITSIAAWNTIFQNGEYVFVKF